MNGDKGFFDWDGNPNYEILNNWCDYFLDPEDVHAKAGDKCYYRSDEPSN